MKYRKNVFTAKKYTQAQTNRQKTKRNSCLQRTTCIFEKKFSNIFLNYAFHGIQSVADTFTKLCKVFKIEYWKDTFNTKAFNAKILDNDVFLCEIKISLILQ